MRSMITYWVMDNHYNELTKAMTAAAFVYNDPSRVTINTNQEVIIDFDNMHEVVTDILRNPAREYRVVNVRYDESDERVHETVGEFDVQKAIEWVVAHLSDISTMIYKFDRLKGYGMYSFSRDMSYAHTHLPFCIKLIEKL